MKAMPSKIVSSDSHIVEPPNLWQDRMSKRKWGDRIPRVGKGEVAGADDMYVDGQPMGVLFRSFSDVGRRFDDPDSIRLEGSVSDTRLGAYDPVERIKDMDADGVYADVIYPSMLLNMWSAIGDASLGRVVFAAYNDWLADFCAKTPRRLFGIGQILLEGDIKAGIRELERIAGLGLGGVMISVYPRPEDAYDKPIYEPFWAAVQDVGLPLSLHIGTKRPTAQETNKNNPMIKMEPSPSQRANVEYWARMSLSQIVYSGVCERYPRLKFVQLEHELSWVPFFIDRLDYVYREKPQLANHRFKSGALPSDFMRQNVFHSFQEDGLGIRNRDFIGVENLLWGSDYPHIESTFPRSRQILGRILKGVPEAEKAKITGENTARVYGIRGS